jgi:peptidoglycan L-alanyl-D-glutamate endopeptidase CwlK
MATFGQKSKDRLATCHPDIQKVMNEAIKEYDFTVLFGTRTPQEQFELFKKGRTLKDGKWVKVGATVTNLDGINKKSEHNYSPSRAIDIAPYPIDWNNLQRFKDLSVIVKRIAKELGVDLVWGGDWERFSDKPHYQLGKSYGKA